MMTYSILAVLAVAFPVKDLSADKSGDVVVAAGTERDYQGHPTTVQTADGRIIAVWCTPHGGHCGPAAESKDGGRTWTRIDDRFPASYQDHGNCPSIYRLVGPDGKARLWVWSQTKRRAGDKPGDVWTCCKDLTRAMPSVMSEDEGKTWKEMPMLGGKFACVMAFSSIVRLEDGSYLGMFHTGPSGGDKSPLRVQQSVTKDGGFTWSDPVEVCRIEGKDPCEPYVFRSPKGDELCCLMRENSRGGRSLMMFSRDEGKTWTTAVDTPWALTGDRHQGVQLKDGRLCIVFRDMAPESPTAGHFVGWVGSYDELKSGERGLSYRIKLLHSYASWDCGYPGIHLLEDGTLLVTTYIKYWDDKRLQSVVSKRFTIAEADKLPNVNGAHVIARIADSAKFEDRNPHFRKAFAFLKRKDLADLKPGRYEIDGDNCWAMMQECGLKPMTDEVTVEAHRKYIDIQSPITGRETIGLFTMDAAHRTLEFDEEKDCVLFEARTRPVTLEPGEFAIFFPPDGAHAPGHCMGEARVIRKLVIKVKDN